jgi:hypothetical protein
MKPAHRRASVFFVLVFASLSVLAASGPDDRDEPVVIPIVKTASTDQSAFKPKSIAMPEPACVNSDFWMNDCLTPTEHPRPQAPDPSPFA